MPACVTGSVTVLPSPGQIRFNLSMRRSYADPVVFIAAILFAAVVLAVRGCFPSA